MCSFKLGNKLINIFRNASIGTTVKLRITSEHFRAITLSNIYHTRAVLCILSSFEAYVSRKSMSYTNIPLLIYYSIKRYLKLRLINIQTRQTENHEIYICIFVLCVLFHCMIWFSVHSIRQNLNRILIAAERQRGSTLFLTS